MYKLTYKQYYPEGFEVRKPLTSGERTELGGLNDASYAVKPTVNGRQVRCPAYTKWTRMLERAYCEKYHAKYPTYIGTRVCQEWLDSFMVFRKWFFAELSKTNQQPGDVRVDKDYLTDKKLYSPKTCILISDSLNSLLNGNGAIRGDLPQGVGPNGSGYQARVRTPERQENLGTFKTVAEAFNVYIKRKTEVIKSAQIPYWLDEDKIRRRLLTIFRRQMRAQRIEFADIL